MKNRLILVVVIAWLANPLTYSQIKFGICGGINSSKLKGNSEITTSDYKIKYPNYALLGYHVGLIGQVQLFNLFIQPELLYTATRNDINIYNLSGANPNVATAITQKLNQIDVPVLVGFKFKILKLEAGPVATFLISDNSDLKTITSCDMQMNKATIGFQAGAGLDIGKIALDVTYEGNLSKLGNGIKVAGNNVPFDSRLSQIIVSVGFFF